MLILKLQTTVSGLSFVFISSSCVFSLTHRFLFSSLFIKLSDPLLIGFIECSLSKYSWIQGNLCLFSVWLNCFLFSEFFALPQWLSRELSPDLSWQVNRPAFFHLPAGSRVSAPSFNPGLGVGADQQITGYFEDNA